MLIGPAAIVLHRTFETHAANALANGRTRSCVRNSNPPISRDMRANRIDVRFVEIRIMPASHHFHHSHHPISTDTKHEMRISAGGPLAAERIRRIATNRNMNMRSHFQSLRYLGEHS